MSGRRALIVDDSATARVVLGRLLVQHGLAVDGAADAAEALDYLKRVRPDVIFMDHQMPGMDGLEALRAIKANPDTATIPVMMYTSQEGEVYVGQARALGAVGVLPKQVQPVEVSQVLRSLHLVGEGPSDIAAAAQEVDASVDDGEDLRHLLTDMFEQQRTLLREELRSVSPPAPAPTARDSGLRAWLSASLLLAAVALLLGWLWLDTRAQLADARGHAQRMTVALQQEGRPERRAVTRRPAAVANPVDWVGAMEWALNRDVRLHFSETALGDRQAELLGTLVPRLDALGFRGVIEVQAHVGRFCMVAGEDGALRPASPDARLADCEQLGWTAAQARLRGSRQTLAFANALAALNAEHGARVGIVVDSRGSDEPSRAYPLAVDELPAGDWNDVAADNHRVEIRLHPAVTP